MIEDCATIITGGTPKTSVERYWFPKEIPWMASGEINKKRIYKTEDMISKEGYSNSSAKMVNEKSVLIALAGQGKTRGTVAVTEIALTTNQSIAAIEPHKDISYEFLFQNLESRYEELRTYSSGDGSRGGLNKKLVSEFPIISPVYNEQYQIGLFFKTLDKLITLYQRKNELNISLKSIYTKKLLANYNENLPEIRFKKYNSEWDNKTLYDISKYKNGKSLEDYQSSSGEFEVINLNSITIDGKLQSSGKFINHHHETLNKGDIVMILSDIGRGKLLGRTAVIPENKKYVLNQRVALIRPNNFTDSQFITISINTNQDYFRSHGAGMSQLNLSRNSVEKFKVKLPTFDEQQKIGCFFKTIQIFNTQYELKIELIDLLKKYYLRAMFV